jgi:leader peptidase (prepilin peptidase) / N-methyltransferase
VSLFPVVVVIAQFLGYCRLLLVQRAAAHLEPAATAVALFALLENDYALVVIVFVFGLAIGSFLNVCIYRLPRGESIVRPRSHCPGCNKPVASYDNIPLLSYAILGGKCRRCRTRISAVYPAVELATGLVFAFLFARFGIGVEFVKLAVFCALMIVLVMTDWGLMADVDEYKRLLPDRVTFPGMFAGLVFGQLVPVGDGSAALMARLAGVSDMPWRAESLLDSMLGALAGGGLLYLLGRLYFLLRRQEGMGLGDVKMMAMAGFFLGPKLVLLSIWFASVTGALLGGGAILVFRKDWRSYEIPFGSFLGLASMAAAVWGNQFLRWYLDFFH